MAITVAPGSSATFTIGAFGTIDLTASAASTGTLTFTAGSLDNLRSDASFGLQSKTYGPFGVPGSVTITVTTGVVTYDVVYTEGGGAVASTYTDLTANYPAASNAGNSAMVGGLIYDAFNGAWRLRGSASGLPVYSWKDRPDPTTYVGDVIFRDIGVRGSRWTSDGLYWHPAGGNPIVLDVQNFDVAYTDDRTTEQVLYEYHIPPGLMRENYAIEVMAKNTWGAFGSAVTRSLRFYVGSAQLGATNNGGATALTSTKWHGFSFENKNALGSQIGEANGYAGVAAQQSSVGFTTSTADSTKYIALQIRGIITTLGSGTMTNALNAVRLTLIPGY